MRTSDEVLEYWIEEVGPSGWYRSDPELDQDIRDRFMETWEAAASGSLCEWTTAPTSALAFIILTDQFPRNMFREDGRAFATDRPALACAKKMIDREWDWRVPEPQRQFVFMPLMHSECLSDQERCVRLMCSHMPESGSMNLLHAKAHRDVIREFGRFPYRNEALARSMRSVEQEYIENGGYGSTVRKFQAHA